MAWWLKTILFLYVLMPTALGVKRVPLNREHVLDCEKLAIEPKKCYKGKVFQIASDIPVASKNKGSPSTKNISADLAKKHFRKTFHNR